MKKPLTRVRAGAMVLVVGVAIAGCSTVPTSGPVGESTQNQTSDSDIAYTFNPAPPTDGASPETVVQGFVAAASGVQDDFSIAREYLTPELAEEWDPSERTLVYSAQPTVVSDGSDESYTVQFDVESMVDSDGVLTDMPENSTEAMTVETEEVDGEWRISKVPDGISLDSAQFSALYASHTLYFYDRSYRYAVPDVRWFLNRQGQSTQVVEALLDGPAPYLDGAVASAFGESAELDATSVPVDSGTAEVQVSQETAEGASDLALQRMQQQLELTLSGMARIDEVEMRTENNRLSWQSEDSDFNEIDSDTSVGSTQIGIDRESGQLVHYEGSVSEIEGLADVSYLNPQRPTMNTDADTFAFLNGEGDTMHIANQNGGLDLLATGNDLTAPSMDTANWVWTVSHPEDSDDDSEDSESEDQDSQILAAPATIGNTEVRQISADWLDSETISSLKVSPDGARAAIVVGSGEDAELQVAGIVRDSSGTPMALSQPTTVDTSVPMSEVVWYSPEELLVAETSDSERVVAEIVGINGTQATLNALLGMQSISAGSGTSNIYADTADDLYLRVGSSWRPQPGDVTDLSYPG